MYHGLTKERYEQLLQAGATDQVIESSVYLYGPYAVQTGYALSYHPRHELLSTTIDNALHVKSIDSLLQYQSDWEACRMAEKQGVRFINDMPGLEKGYYIDTPENREICKQALIEHPEFRVENWLDPGDGEWGTRYAQSFMEHKPYHVFWVPLNEELCFSVWYAPDKYDGDQFQMHLEARAEDGSMGNFCEVLSSESYATADTSFTALCDTVCEICKDAGINTYGPAASERVEDLAVRVFEIYGFEVPSHARDKSMDTVTDNEPGHKPLSIHSVSELSETITAVANRAYEIVTTKSSTGQYYIGYDAVSDLISYEDYLQYFDLIEDEMYRHIELLDLDITDDHEFDMNCGYAWCKSFEPLPDEGIAEGEYDNLDFTPKPSMAHLAEIGQKLLECYAKERSLAGINIQEFGISEADLAYSRAELSFLEKIHASEGNILPELPETKSLSEQIKDAEARAANALEISPESSTEKSRTGAKEHQK